MIINEVVFSMLNPSRNRICNLFVVGMAICWSMPCQVGAQDNVVPLLSRIPDSANTIAIIRVQEILKSPKAITERWNEKQAENVLFGSDVVPTWVDTLVVGSQVRMGEFSKIWSVAVLGVPPVFSLEGLARRENSKIEELGGRRAVRGRRDAFFVDLGERVLGVMSPAYRQDVSRWARRASTAKGGVSEYLTTAATTSAQILLALDVEDAYDQAIAREQMSKQPILDEAKIPIVDVLEELRALRGLRFLAIVKDQTEAKIVLDFAEAVKLPPDVLKALTVNAINDYGMFLPELGAARPAVSGKTFVLSMDNFSDESLRAVLSLVITAAPERQATSAEAAVTELAPKTPLPAPKAVTSAADVRSAIVPEPASTTLYLASVTRIVSDLYRNLNRANDYLRTATWHDNFAAKIDRLSASGVDPKAIEFGQRMSSRLRALAASIRGVAVKVNVEEGSIVYNTYVTPEYAYYGLWGGVGYQPGYVNVDSNLQAVRERQASAIIAGAEQRAQIWKMIQDDINATVRGVPPPTPEPVKPAPERVKPPATTSNN